MQLNGNLTKQQNLTIGVLMSNEVKPTEVKPQQPVLQVIPANLLSMLCSLVAEGQYPDKKWKDVNEVMVLVAQNTPFLNDYITKNETPYCLKEVPKEEVKKEGK